jgi:beta-N-acetylhexosaminidase
MFIENLEGSQTFRSYETIGAMTGTDDERPLIAGGYIFFSYNIGDSRDQMQEYIKSIRLYCDSYDNIQPYLCVDQEGGWVSRLKKLNPKLPSNEQVAQTYYVSETYRLYSEQAA